MLELATSILPIGLGFVAKLFAIKSKAASDNQKLMLQNMAANTESTNAAREFSKSESPMAALNRRFIIIVILGLIVFLQVSPVLFDVDTVLETTKEGISFLGLFQITPDVVEYVSLNGVIKYQETFDFASLIVSFYFGSSLAKA
jgi:hypothetical protein|tara:strand:- start:1117 stop:1548 length:432 start_codon:yes stop_codon:yes gene_type:complete